MLHSPRDGVWLHGQGLDVSRVAVLRPSGEPVAARWVPGQRDCVAPRARWDAPLGMGEVTLSSPLPALLNRQLEGLYRVESGGDAYAFTQFEVLSARRAFPCFDEPRLLKTPFDITVVTARDHQAITNTAEASAATATTAAAPTASPSPRRSPRTSSPSPWGRSRWSRPRPSRPTRCARRRSRCEASPRAAGGATCSARSTTPRPSSR